MSEPTPLSRAERMLAAIATAQDALDVIDFAEAARVWAIESKRGTAAVNHATVIKVRAESALADVVDQGQATGQIAGVGRPEKPSGGEGFPQTFEDLGLAYGRVSEARLLRATYPRARLMAMTERANTDDKVLSRGAMLADARRAANKTTAAQLAELGLKLPAGRYATIEIDPPWSYDELGIFPGGTSRSAEHKYPTMTTDTIADLPIAALAGEQSHLYLWATYNHLQHAWRIADHWGFTVRNLLVWDKQRIGLGNYFRNSAEYIIFATLGGLPLLRHDQPTVYQWPAERVHSRKPDGFYELAETCSPGPRVRLFARAQRAGWTSWGNETEASA